MIFKLKSLEKFYILYILAVIAFTTSLVFALFLKIEENNLKKTDFFLSKKISNFKNFSQNLHKVEKKVKEYGIKKLSKEEAYITLYKFIEFLKKNYDIQIQKAPYEKNSKIYATATLDYKYTGMEDLKKLFETLLNSVSPLADIIHMEQKLTTEGTILKIEILLIQPFKESK